MKSDFHPITAYVSHSIFLLNILFAMETLVTTWKFLLFDINTVGFPIF